MCRDQFRRELWPLKARLESTKGRHRKIELKPADPSSGPRQAVDSQTEALEGEQPRQQAAAADCRSRSGGDSVPLSNNIRALVLAAEESVSSVSAEFSQSPHCCLATKVCRWRWTGMFPGQNSIPASLHPVALL